MNQFSNLNLKKNPFENITPSLQENERRNLIWAGLDKLKMRLEDVHEKSISSGAHKIILNWGAWGAGKTFAAFYFNHYYLQERFQKAQGQLLHIYIRLPKNANEATKQLFRDVLDYLSLSTIKERIRSVISEFDENYIFNFINLRIRSEEYTKAIIKLADTNNEISEMMSRYLFVGSTKTELKKLGLSRSLNSDIDMIKMLTGILLCFVMNHDPIMSGRIFLWIDEMEDLIYYNSKQYKIFSQILRDLFDQMSEGLTIFMNFTLKEPEEGTIKLLLGDALWSRITQKIRFKELSIEDGLIYCKDLIQKNQIKRNKYSPFTEKSLHSLLELIPSSEMTPREINKICSEVLNFAIEQNASEISEKIVSSWLSQKTDE